MIPAKAGRLALFLVLCLTLAGCAGTGDVDTAPPGSGNDNPGDQPPGERKDGLGIVPGGAGFKRTF